MIMINLKIVAICVMAWFTVLGNTTAIETNTNIPEYTIVADTTDKALADVYDADPFLYLIIVGLIVAVGYLALTTRILWLKNQDLSKEKDDVQDSKIKIAVSSTETIKEALTLIEHIYSQVSKLTDSDATRQLTDNDIKNQLKNISKDIDHLSKEIRKALKDD